MAEENQQPPPPPPPPLVAEPPPPPPPPLVAVSYDGSTKDMFHLLNLRANDLDVIPYDRCVSRNLYEAPAWDLIEEGLEYAIPGTYEWLVDSPRALANLRDINRRVGGQEAILFWKRNHSEKTVADWQSEEVLGTVANYKLMFIGKEYEQIRLNWYMVEYVAKEDRLRSICKVRVENDQLTKLRKDVISLQGKLEQALVAKYLAEKKLGDVLPQDSPPVTAVVAARDRLTDARKAVTAAVHRIRIDNIMEFDRVFGLKREAARGAIVDQQIAAGLANQNEEDNADHLAWAAGDANSFAAVPVVE